MNNSDLETRRHMYLILKTPIGKPQGAIAVMPDKQMYAAACDTFRFAFSFVDPRDNFINRVARVKTVGRAMGRYQSVTLKLDDLQKLKFSLKTIYYAWMSKVHPYVDADNCTDKYYLMVENQDKFYHTFLSLLADLKGLREEAAKEYMASFK